MASRSASALARALLLLSLLQAGCSDPAGRQGRPEYFERITGLPMLMEEPRYACQRGTFIEAAAVASYRLSAEQLAWFADPPEVFGDRPLIYGDPAGRARQTWRSGTPEANEMRMWGSALGALYYVLDGEKCGEWQDVKGAADELRRALARPTSLYAYTYLPQPKDSLLLSWYIIDPEARFFWIIDSSP